MPDRIPLRKRTAEPARTALPSAALSPPPKTFADVIALWSSAADLAALLDVEAVTVRAWRRRGIPARYWAAVAEAARFSGRPVDERLLAGLGSIRKGRAHG